jgi:hypothetical protein
MANTRETRKELFDAFVNLLTESENKIVSIQEETETDWAKIEIDCVSGDNMVIIFNEEPMSVYINGELRTPV